VSVCEESLNNLAPNWLLTDMSYAVTISKVIATLGLDQSHYIEVAQRDIFMENEMRFGMVLGQLAILKKNGGRL
jgi:hypothetical protein